MRKSVFYILICLVGFIGSCKTDFELNAPYETIPVVYGLLDQTLDTQYIKINKSFLGDGNNVDYAAINDCTHFNYLSAILEEYNESGDLIDTDSFQEIMVGNIDAGIFYEDTQSLYYLNTTSDPLIDEYTYHLKVSVPDKNLNFNALTELVDASALNFGYIFRITSQLNGFRCADNDLATNDEYYDTQIKWNSVENGKRYELVLKFHFTEHMSNGDIVSRYIDWDLGYQSSVSVEGTEDMYKTVSGASFFDMVNAKLDNYDLESQVVKRTFGSKAIEYVLTVGNETLHTYMQVNEPITSVVTERPIFTNVNNGYGLFASKAQTNFSCFVGNGTVVELCKGQVTGEYKFCCDSSDQIIAISNLTGGLDVGCN